MMNVLVSGASGLVGSALVSHLTARSYSVARLVRRKPVAAESEIFWDPDGGRIDTASLARFDAVVHLAGANIASGRWTQGRKRGILGSRIHGTRLLSTALAALEKPPKVMVSTSAVGYYGSRGDEILREESSPGSGFLAEVCRRWEEAAVPAAGTGIRLVVLRMGMVLSATGGALRRMLPPFRLGAGGRIGAGNQFMSWIALDDLLEIIVFALKNPSLRGAVNSVAPEPVTNREFTRTLGKVLRRPAFLPVPASVIRLLFGEMGEEVLLASTRVEPASLAAAGFEFRYGNLEAALRHVLAH
jgi:uncharacterized protein (TIGR01777 family)